MLSKYHRRLISGILGNSVYEVLSGEALPSLASDLTYSNLFRPHRRRLLTLSTLTYSLDGINYRLLPLLTYLTIATLAFWYTITDGEVFTLNRKRL